MISELNKLIKKNIAKSNKTKQTKKIIQTKIKIKEFIELGDLSF